MDPVAAITTAVAGLATDLQDVAVLALPIGASIFALGVGWRLLRKFVKA